jgi:hypothetical protein
MEEWDLAGLFIIVAEEGYELTDLELIQAMHSVWAGPAHINDFRAWERECGWT